MKLPNGLHHAISRTVVVPMLLAWASGCSNEPVDLTLRNTSSSTVTGIAVTLDGATEVASDLPPGQSAKVRFPKGASHDQDFAVEFKCGNVALRERNGYVAGWGPGEYTLYFVDAENEAGVTLSAYPIQPFRVLTWNIQGCPAGLGPVTESLRRYDADLVCLQEAEAGTDDGGDQAALIAGHLKLHQVSAGSPFATRAGRQQMAILARQPLEAREPLDAGTGRIYGVTAMTRLRERTVRVVCVHLTNSYWQGIRQALSAGSPAYREAADLSRRLEAWTGAVVLAGDFNAVPGMGEHDVIARRLQRVPTTQPTFPADRPRFSIDHIYHSEDLRLIGFETPASRASDHRPVIAQMKCALLSSTRPAG